MKLIIRSALSRRVVASTCALATAAALAAAVAAPADARPPGPATPVHPDQVLLPTGERIGLHWSGDTPRIVRLPGQRDRLAVSTAGNHVYAFPPEAMPYLGSALDRNLFDVTALAARQASGAGRVPVSLRFDGAPVDVPGVRVTSTSGGHTTGYLDAGSAARFGAALRAGVRDDLAGTRRLGTPVAGLTGMSLRGAADGTANPDFPQVTLTVKLIPPDGGNLLGSAVTVTNIDDSRKYGNIVGIGPDNLEKISVPKGHYTLVGVVDTAKDDGTFDHTYVPIVADYAVDGDGQTVTVDARKATAVPSFDTPQPSDPRYEQMDVVPTDGVHESRNGWILGYLYDGDVLVQPTAAPDHGVLEFDTYQSRSLTGSDDTARYRLTAEWLDGIPADLRRTVRPGDLARVEDRVYHPTSGPRTYGRGPAYPDLRGVVDLTETMKATTHVDYLYGPPDVRWPASVTQDGTAGGESMSSNAVRYRPGRSYTVDWFRESLAPGFQAGVTFPRPYCVACRTTDQLALEISSEMDADPHHSGAVGSEVSGHTHLRVLQDGTSIADVSDIDSVPVPVPAEEHTYRIEETVDRAKLGFTTATHTSAVYTVRSSATSGEPVPSDWICTADYTAECTVLPLLTTNVPLPTDRAGAVPVGVSSFVVRVGHVPAGADPAISSLAFATAIDGTDFHRVPVVRLGGGRYRVLLATPPATAGHHVSIRLHAEDAAGGTVTQTVTDAYTVTSS